MSGTHKMTSAQIQDAISQLQPSQGVFPTPGGLQFKDAAPLIAGVVENGVCPDDPRVLTRLNEATKIILDTLIPVGGMAQALVTAVNTLLVLPPSMENCIEAVPFDSTTSVRGDKDVTQGWYEIVNNSTYLDPFQHHDNPVIDFGLWPKGTGKDAAVLVRVYAFPGLQPANATVVVTGAKRYIPITQDNDYLIVQNIEAIKLVIQSIERIENNQTDDGLKLRDTAMKLLQDEVKKHILDPRNYMRRKSQYYDEMVSFPENTMGWMRANIALDVEEALKSGRQDLIWSINQAERRIMQRGIIYKDMIVRIKTTVTGGTVYFPVNVEAVLAVDLNGQSIPIRSEFFQYLENGPGAFPAYSMLIDQGNEKIGASVRRKYKLIANCTEGQTLSAVCLLKWVSKKPEDYMTIKNYEVMRMMMTSKFLEEREDWKNAQANQQAAFDLLDKELKTYLSGILHTVHVQTTGFGLGDTGNYWSM